MVKFTFRDHEDREHLGLGITAENVARMKEGKPIKVDIAALGLSVNGSVMVFYGDTEQTLYNALKEFVGPDTKLHVDPRVVKL